jgi:di-N-acetylchitobiase
MLAHSDSEGLVCRAHAAQARVLRGCEMNISEIFDGGKRVAAISRSIEAVRAGFLDGLYFDYELPLGRNQSELSAAFTSYVGQATRMLHAAIPGSKLVVATAWSPDDIDGRDYDYARLARNSDYLFVMNYDTRSAIYGRCIASANAPLSKTARSIQRYLDIGVDASKLIFGLPCVSCAMSDYPCAQLNRTVR